MGGGAYGNVGAANGGRCSTLNVVDAKVMTAATTVAGAGDYYSKGVGAMMGIGGRIPIGWVGRKAATGA
jgi:hypothetical protein